MAYQPVDIGSAPNDGTGDPIRDAFDKCNDNFVELYAALTGLVELKGSTDCSTNPNYPAASAGDAYRVSVAGKIGGASGIDVEVGDLYYALADNAGGDQATVGTSWDVLQGNTTSSGGTVDVEDEGTPVISATTINFTGAGVVATDAGGGQVDVTIAGGGGGVDVEEEGGAVATATTLNFVGSAVTATDAGSGQVDVTITGGGGALEYIGSYTPSAVASFDIENFAGLSGYSSIEIEIEKLTVSTDTTGLTAQYKLNGAYQSGASSYKHTRSQLFTATTASNGGSTGDTKIDLTGSAAGSIGNASGEGASGILTLLNPYDTAGWKRCRFELGYIDDQAAQRLVQVLGHGTYSGTDATGFALGGVRIAASTGTLTATVHVRGRKTS